MVDRYTLVNSKSGYYYETRRWENCELEEPVFFVRILLGTTTIMRKSDDKACRQQEENEPPSQLTAIFIHFPVGIVANGYNQETHANPSVCSALAGKSLFLIKRNTCEQPMIK